MAIDLSYVSPARFERISQAESADKAASMGFFDSLIDKLFRGGAKESAIRALFSVMGNQASNSGPKESTDRLQAFLNFRSLMLPEHREKLVLEFIENPDASCDYAFHLDGQVIYERKDITVDADIAELRRTRSTIKVDDYLMALQGHAPQAASLVQRSDRFLIEQGKVGDCYALATMIGIMSNPGMHRKIEDMAQITADNKLRLNFDVLSSAPNVRDAGMEFELSQETLLRICSDESELASMRAKGYDITLEHGVLRLDISEAKLRAIIGETRSANTNSLIVNILEHFSGNLLVRVEEILAETDIELIDDDSHSDFTFIDSTTVRHAGLRSDRESLLAHSNRVGGYDPLIANLLGYAGGRTSLRPVDSEELLENLLGFNEKNRCLASGATQGFVYVGMRYSQADEHGNYHGAHALVLHSIEFDIAGKPTGIYLQNPWGNRRAPELFPINELLGREIRFTEYYPAYD